MFFAKIMLGDKIYPCFTHRSLVLLGGIAIYANGYVFRCWHLFHIARIQKEKMAAFDNSRREELSLVYESKKERAMNDEIDAATINTNQPNTMEYSFFMRRRYFMEPKTLWNLYVMSMIAWYVAFFLVVFTVAAQTVNDCSKKIIEDVLTGIVLAYLVLLAIFGIALRNVDDNFNIKIEFKGGIVTWLIVIALWIPSSIYFTNQLYFDTVPIYILYPIGYIVTFCLAVLYQLIQSLSFQRFDVAKEEKKRSTSTP